MFEIYVLLSYLICITYLGLSTDDLIDIKWNKLIGNHFAKAEGLIDVFDLCIIELFNMFHLFGVINTNLIGI